MKRSFLSIASLCVGILLSVSLALHANAQEPKGEKKKELTKLEGRVQMISKDASTVTIQRGNNRVQVLYDANTKFTYRNKPGSIDDVKEGRRVICLIKENDKKQIVAARIDVREGK